jgi:hypothetical protein
VPAATEARSMSPVDSFTSDREVSSRRAGLLDQPFILVREQMRLHLRHRVHRDETMISSEVPPK